MPETKKYLNRDGLEEYNSLLPHSSSEIQEYVDDWLDTHPEATTTVPDDGITTRKLADGSVTRNKLAADVAHLLGGMMVTGEVQGEILSTDDAYSVAPLSMEIDGKSTQDGTPTPDAPVEIVSLEQVNLRFAGKNLFPIADGNISGPGYRVYEAFNNAARQLTFAENTQYTVRMDVSTSSATGFFRVQFLYTDDTTSLSGYIASATAYKSLTSTAGKSVKSLSLVNYNNGAQISLSNIQLEIGATYTPYQPYNATSILLNLPQALRSLPDGTHDKLSFSYLRQSTREGLAWYGRTLNKLLDVLDMGTLVWSAYSGTKYRANVAGKAIGDYNVMSTAYSVTTAGVANMADGTIRGTTQANLVYARNDACADAAAMQAACAGETLLYQLATPVTTTLDPIELPVLPAPNCTVWSDPRTGLKMSYMRDANIVISDIEQAIADL